MSRSPGLERQQADPGDLSRQVADTSSEQGWRAGIALIAERWDELLTTRPDALLAGIKALPGEALVELPSLLVAANYVQHVMKGDDSRRFHDIPFDEHGRDTRESDLLDSLIAITGRTAGRRTAGKLSQAVSNAMTGRRLLEESSDQERAGLRRALPQFLIQWGRAFEVAEVGGAREYEEAWEIAVLTEQPQIARRAASSLAWLHADHGRLGDAATWAQRARSTGAASVRYDAVLHLAAALISIDRLDPESASRHLEALAEVASGDYWAAEYWVRSWVTTCAHEAALLRQRLDAEIQRHPIELLQSGAHRRYVAAAAARLAALQNRPSPDLSVPAVDSPFDRVMMAAAAYRAGRNHDVLLHAAPGTVVTSGPRLQVTSLLLTAAARLALKRTSAAVSAFTTAHTFIEAEGLYSAYGVVAPEHLEQLVSLTGLTGAGLAVPGGERAGALNGLGGLTRREREVLILLASDRPLSQVASELYISSNTVKGVTRNLYRKLGVHSRVEAADVAHRAGLV